MVYVQSKLGQQNHQVNNLIEEKKNTVSSKIVGRFPPTNYKIRQSSWPRDFINQYHIQI